MPETETHHSNTRGDLLHEMRKHPTFGELADIVDAHIADTLAEERKAQKAAEDVRANHRNKNRVLMLVVAAVWSFLLPLMIVGILGAAVLASISGFLLFITLIPDLFLSLYSYVRKY